MDSVSAMSHEAGGSGGSHGARGPEGQGSRDGERTDGYVETRGPLVPDAVTWFINPIVRAILRSPLHPLLSDSILLLTFTGQQSGTEYSVPVAYWRNGSQLFVITHGDWWRNLRGGEPVFVRIEGRERTAVATPHPDPETVAEYMQAYIQERGIEDVHRLGIRVHGDREPTLEELQAGVEGAVVVEIDLEV